MTICTKRFFLPIALCAALLPLFTQCGDDKWQTVSYDACVLKYCDISDIDCIKCKRTISNSFYIQLRIKHMKCCKFNDTGANKEIYDSLRNVRNDVYHTSKAMITSNGDLLPIPFYNSLAFPEVTHIDVVCGTDFDASHPAGSSLRSYVTVRSMWGKADPNKCGPISSEVKAAALDNQALYLENEIVTLTLSKLPDDPNATHTFTVQITTADGKTYADSITVSRIEWDDDDDDD